MSNEREDSILATAIIASMRTQGEERLSIPESVKDANDFHAWLHEDELPFPKDFLEPDWTSYDVVPYPTDGLAVDWKYRVTTDVREVWLNLTQDQRRKLAANFLLIKETFT